MKGHNVEIETDGVLAKTFVIDGKPYGVGCEEYRIIHRGAELPTLELFADGEIFAKYPLEHFSCKMGECEVLNECTPLTP